MKLPIPAAALSQHIIALGKTRSGKSSKIRLIVEQLLDQDKPVCIIDPKGDWWGLKSSADGKHAGYRIVIFGGDHADVPLTAHAGAAVAELIATGNRPALIDLGGWMIGERTRFFVDFAGAFFKLTRGQRFLVIDEVHNFAPQGRVMDPDSGKMLHWANRLASEGAGKGVTLIAASQRPQKVHKDFVTSCETLIACRVVHKLDRDAIKDWIDGCADPEKGRAVLRDLAGMDRKQAWVWSPEIDFGPECIIWPMFRTYDSFKPQAADLAKLKGWADVNLADVQNRLAAAIEEHERNDPAKLRARIAELERASKGKGAAPLQDPKLVQAAEERTYARGHAAGAQEVQRKVKETMRARKGELHRAVELAFAGVDFAPVKTPVSPGVKSPPAPRPSIQKVLEKSRREPGNGAGEELTIGQRRVLSALLSYPEGLTREQLTVLAGYKRSTRDLYLQQLVRAGLVHARGDALVATDAGAAALPDAEPLPTGEALRAHWLQRLPEGERKVLEALIEAYPNWIERDELGDRAGYKRSTRDLYLQRLARRKLVRAETGQVAAAEELFA